jgi:hypothetical protein
MSSGLNYSEINYIDILETPTILTPRESLYQIVPRQNNDVINRFNKEFTKYQCSKDNNDYKENDDETSENGKDDETSENGKDDETSENGKDNYINEETTTNFINQLLNLKNKIILFKGKSKRIKEEIEILQKEVNTSNEMISLHYQLILSYNNLLNANSDLFKNINLCIPFDDEQEIMIIKNNIVDKYQKIEEKTYQNMILNTKILKLKDTMLYIKTQMNEIDEDINFSKKSSCLCNICDENKINICLIPCGHTFCNICLSKTIGNLCPYCRENINFHNKLFIE